MSYNDILALARDKGFTGYPEVRTELAYKETSDEGFRAYELIILTLIQMWLREDHGVYVQTEVVWCNEDKPRYDGCAFKDGISQALWQLTKVQESSITTYANSHKQYNKALIEGLQQALKLI